MRTSFHYILAMSAWFQTGLSSSQLLARATNETESLPAYRNSSLCVNARVEDLLQRMTVEEKVGQRK